MTNKTAQQQQQISRLLKVLNKIKKNPENWDQEMFHYGKCRCFSGMADAFRLKASKADIMGVSKDGKIIDYIMSSKNGQTVLRSVLTSLDPWESGRKWLGLTYEQAHKLFDEEIDTIMALTSVVSEIIEEIFQDTLASAGTELNTDSNKATP